MNHIAGPDIFERHVFHIDGKHPREVCRGRGFLPDIPRRRYADRGPWFLSVAPQTTGLLPRTKEILAPGPLWVYREPTPDEAKEKAWRILGPYEL